MARKVLMCFWALATGNTASTGIKVFSNITRILCASILTLFLQPSVSV